MVVWIGRAGQMVADLDMDTAGAEAWGEDAELNLGEGIYYNKTILWRRKPNQPNDRITYDLS